MHDMFFFFSKEQYQSPIAKLFWSSTGLLHALNTWTLSQVLSAMWDVCMDMYKDWV